MRIRGVRWVLAGALVWGLAPAVSAHAATDLGYLSVTPSSGTIAATSFVPGSIPTFATSAPCPSAADSYLLSLSGPGLPSGGVVWTAGDAGFSSTSAFTVDAGLSIGDATTGVIAAASLDGAYVVRLDCIASSQPGTSLGSATTKLDLDGSANHWVAEANPGASGSAADPQAIEVTVPPGTLAISTPYTPSHPLNLGALTLDAGGNLLHTSADFGSLADPQDGITVVDTRTGVQGWSVSAVATDFVDGAGDRINAQNVGLTDLTPVFIGGNALQSGIVATDAPAADPPVAPGATGTMGLAGSPHEVAATDHGIGTVRLVGTMTLNAPTSTHVGTYVATVTFTLV